MNDPLFFLHQTGVDRIWAMWQDIDRKNRLYDTGTNVTGIGLFNIFGKSLGLETPLWIGVAGPRRSVKDVMDTKGFLCYEYDKLADMYN